MSVFAVCLFWPPIPCPAFHGLVNHIFFVRGDKQVRWVYASRVIAAVANAQAFGYRPHGKLVSYAVSQPGLIVNAYPAVALTVAVLCPFPAPRFYYGRLTPKITKLFHVTKNDKPRYHAPTGTVNGVV